MARAGWAEGPRRVSHDHCASVPPVAARTAGKAAGMVIQALVPRRRGSGAGGLGGKAPRCGPSGGSGRTSSTYANNTSNAWIVNLTDGNVTTDNKTNTNNYVWPVRGGE